MTTMANNNHIMTRTRMMTAIHLLLLIVSFYCDPSHAFQLPTIATTTISTNHHGLMHTSTLATQATASCQQASNRHHQEQRHHCRSLVVLQNKNTKNNDNDSDDNDDKKGSAVKINPIALPFLVLIGADLLLNIFFLAKRTLEFAVSGQAPSTETWW